MTDRTKERVLIAIGAATVLLQVGLMVFLAVLAVRLFRWLGH